MFLSVGARVEASLYERLRGETEAQGLRWFEGVYDLNIHGVRATADESNLFDDVIVCAYRDDTGVRRVERWPATTDPGRKALEHPVNPGGTFTMAPGQVRKLWTRGRHRSKYPALVHRPGVVVPGWRGSDRTKLWADAAGINLHHAAGASRVDWYSAGCQVLQHPADLERLLQLVALQHERLGTDIVSYTLHAVREHPRLRALLLT